ncbi:MAG: DNA-binding response regulator [Deltaproteobacteria bacterium RBG_16_54_11]|jgi:two-component system phosphate regulon response regulator PhoB|nr:MAG: DNA-binding response regulator [Deltaproteobacteria bacterium RBG_16_54_11]
MPGEKILVVDDEEDIRELVRYNLAREGYQVTTVGSGEEALKQAGAKLPNLIVLDLMLPGIDGFDVCRQLKSDPRTAHIPIVMLTVKGEESDIVVGLELGADDYITKPFSPKVLLARLKAVLRRREKEPIGESDVMTIGDLTIHPGRHEVLVQGKPVKLTSTEFRILHLMARKPGWVFTRFQIVDAARGENIAVTDRSVDFHITSLRRKLGPCSDYIETVWGVGYRFKE